MTRGKLLKEFVFLCAFVQLDKYSVSRVLFFKNIFLYFYILFYASFGCKLLFLQRNRVF